MLLAMTNQKPDRVPVAPDFSNMIPCRLTGKPFWEIYYFENPPLWKAYIEAVKYFGIDGWFTDGTMRFQYPRAYWEAVEDLQKTPERWLVRRRCRMNGIPFTKETSYPVGDPPTDTQKPIKDLEKDMPLLEAMFTPPNGYNPEVLEIQRRELGELGAFGVSLGYPGFHHWFGLVDGGIEALTYAYYDHPELLERLREVHERQALAQMEMILEARPDYVLLSASGTLTLSSPTIARKLALPTIQKLTRMAKEAGIPTMLHSCGKEKLLVKWCAEETDLNCINPLEIPPMGDCDLAEVKRLYGKQIALMGNLHTTNVMLFGSVQDVENAARQAIDDAGQDGGFILSTGDQCGRDTPDENIFKLVEVAKTYGGY
jgi:uroporphyrinogen decarboxylase